VFGGLKTDVFEQGDEAGHVEREWRIAVSTDCSEEERLLYSIQW
jgi:hypothetical protein